MNQELEFRLKQWEKSRTLNQKIPLEEFCADRPELLSEFTEAVEEIQRCYDLRDSILSATLSKPKAISDYKPKDYGLPDKVGGNFVLNSLLGRGHFGSVWRARDLNLSRDVAIKFPFTYLLFNETRINDFLREGKLLTEVSGNSPYIVTVFDSGFINTPYSKEPNIPYIVMELMDGTLSSRSTEELFKSPKEIAEAVIKLGKALHAAHVCESGPLIHRDIKPNNIFYKYDASGDLQIKLGDFGLVLSADVPATNDYRLNGVLEYMSPERLRRKPGDVRSDIYSLGVVFYKLLTGKEPFSEESNSVTLIENIEKGSFPPPATINPALNRYLPLQRICLKAMAADPDCRYDNAAQFVDDLQEAIEKPVQNLEKSQTLEQGMVWPKNGTKIFFNVLIGGIFLLLIFSLLKEREEDKPSENVRISEKVQQVARETGGKEPLVPPIDGPSESTQLTDSKIQQDQHTLNPVSQKESAETETISEPQQWVDLGKNEALHLVVEPDLIKTRDTSVSDYQKAKMDTASDPAITEMTQMLEQMRGDMEEIKDKISDPTSVKQEPPMESTRFAQTKPKKPLPETSEPNDTKERRIIDDSKSTVVEKPKPKLPERGVRKEMGSQDFLVFAAQAYFGESIPDNSIPMLLGFLETSNPYSQKSGLLSILKILKTETPPPNDVALAWPHIIRIHENGSSELKNLAKQCLLAIDQKYKLTESQFQQLKELR